MYSITSFNEENNQQILTDIRNWPFATIITDTNVDYPIISHVPILVRGNSVKNLIIEGHFAKENPHCKHCEQINLSVAIFLGPDSYISPTWYTSDIAVPTWNYVTIHAKGSIELIDNENVIKLHFINMVREFEKNEWSLEKLSNNIYNKLVSSICVFQLKVNKLNEKIKLGQNRSKEDIYGIINGLRETNSSKSIALSEITKKRLFKES